MLNKRSEKEDRTTLSIQLRMNARDGTQVANNKQYLVLLGGPGVGKSTFLRKVGLEALKGKNGNL